jgi:hypothetical protein
MRMLDSITVVNLPDGADAYLGYVGGRWPTWDALRKRFPAAHLLSMAISADEKAEGCDVETGDLTITQAPAWVMGALAGGVWRPVAYASASQMGALLSALQSAGIKRAQVRLLSAHYGAGKHVCGPATCRLCPAVDGTQWTDTASGLNGSRIDESVLLPDFFGDEMPLTDADAQKIAKAVWTIDGVVPGPDGNPANPDWQPQRVLGDLAVQVRKLEASITALAAKLPAK